ncbi:hypothetical protein [Sphingomonas sp.]|uniref:hypothetical protein n=1 Tax=Sphingomonas sp. TaxID=28214 RepID=UPI003D6D17FF
MMERFMPRANIGHSIATGIVLMLGVISPSASAEPAAACKAISAHGKSVSSSRDLIFLPTEIQTDLKSRLGSIANPDEDYQKNDVVGTPALPRWRFDDAVLLNGTWLIFIDGGELGLNSFDYVMQADTETGAEQFSFLSSHRLIGSKCSFISSILDEVEKPADLVDPTAR